MNELLRYLTSEKDRDNLDFIDILRETLHLKPFDVVDNHDVDYIPRLQAVNDKKRSNLKNVQRIAKRRGGKCLSKHYINGRQKLLWQCANGHTWEASLQSIKHENTWCPQARKYKCRSKEVNERRQSV